MKIEKDPSGKRPFEYETKFWHHFGHGEGWDYGRCNRCIEHVYSTKTPSEDTVNCWKVIVFEDASTNFEQVKTHMIRRAEDDARILGKFRLGRDALAVLYTKSEPERDRLRASMLRELKESGLLKTNYLPYRRGCKAFEKVLGPWRDWKASTEEAPSKGPVPELSEYSED